MSKRRYYTYIMASRSRVLYVGMTNNLARRVREHKRKEADSFTARYNVTRLVWYRAFPGPKTPSPPRRQSRAGFGKRRRP